MSSASEEAKSKKQKDIEDYLSKIKLREVFQVFFSIQSGWQHPFCKRGRGRLHIVLQARPFQTGSWYPDHTRMVLIIFVVILSGVKSIHLPIFHAGFAVVCGPAPA